MENRLRQVEITQAEQHIEIESIKDYIERSIKPIITDFNKLTGKMTIVAWIIAFSLPSLVALMTWSVLIIHQGDKQIGIIVANQKNIQTKLLDIKKEQMKKINLRLKNGR